MPCKSFENEAVIDTIIASAEEEEDAWSDEEAGDVAGGDYYTQLSDNIGRSKNPTKIGRVLQKTS